ncbi:MAG: signal peptidase I [Eubacterium sp.]|jgi:signal peptidase I
MTEYNEQNASEESLTVAKQSTDTESTTGAQQSTGSGSAPGTETASHKGQPEEPAPGPRTAKRRRKRAVFEFVRDVIIAVVVAFVIVQFFRPTVVRQSSMLPNFEDGDYLIVSRQAYKLLGGEPDRGDVIVFDSQRKAEDGSEKYLIKRIIGLPGETITITGGVVYINGEPLDQSYTKDGTTSGEIENYVIPEGTYFCCGDNRLNSLDSRSSEIGVVSRDMIYGQVVFRLYPFSKFGTIMDPYED